MADGGSSKKRRGFGFIVKVVVAVASCFKLIVKVVVGFIVKIIVAVASGFGFIVKVLVAVAIVFVVVVIVDDKTRAAMLSPTWKHTFAFGAAVLAIVLSFGQAINAVKKSGKHREFRESLPAGEAGGTLGKVLEHDVKYFSRVGGLWVVGFLGAAATLVAEIIDWNI